jgi:phosphoribosylformylglycinamidine cyclo-ligase
MRLDSTVDDLDPDRTLGEVLLTPTQIYAKDCLALIAETDVHAFAHITGGGLAANLARSLPMDVDAVVDRGTWAPQRIFDVLAQRGRVDRDEMERTFNMGVGMVAVVAAEDADRALALLTARHVDAWLVGEVLTGEGDVRMVGTNASN